MKISIKELWNLLELFLECQSRVSTTLGCIFAREGHIRFFFGRGAWYSVCSSYTHVQGVSHFHVILEKDHLSFFVQRKKPRFREKNTIFPDNTRKIILLLGLFEKTIFSEHLKKILYFHVFFEKDHLSFSVQRVRSYFREK